MSRIGVERTGPGPRRPRAPGLAPLDAPLALEERAPESRPLLGRGRGGRRGGLPQPRARPDQPPGKAERVQPQRVVLGQARGKDVPLPGGRRRLVALEPLDEPREALRALEDRLGRHVLPVEQEAHEVRRRDGRDLAPQPLERVAMDPRQQPPRAPLDARPRPA
jgi:hypothetical protein